MHLYKKKKYVQLYFKHEDLRMQMKEKCAFFFFEYFCVVRIL